MALSQLGNTTVWADLTKVTAKTDVTQKYGQSIWYFKVLLDGEWFHLEYESQGAAEAAWATFT